MATPSEFWAWFAHNASRLRHTEGNELVDEVYDHLREVDERLGVEVSAHTTEDGARELIITAYALREAMPAALDLAERAPALPGWKVIGLRPGGGFGFSFGNDDGGFQGSDLRFVPASSGQRPVRLQLLIPIPLDEIPPGERAQLGWQILNASLGERVAAQIDELEVVSGSEGRPIEELATWLDGQPTQQT